MTSRTPPSVHSGVSAVHKRDRLKRSVHCAFIVRSLHAPMVNISAQKATCDNDYSPTCTYSYNLNELSEENVHDNYYSQAHDIYSLNTITQALITQAH